MKRNIRTHIENVLKYRGSYYFDRNFANLTVRYNEEKGGIEVCIVSYEDSEQQREPIGFAKTPMDTVRIIEENKLRVKKLNSQLKADYLQLVDVAKEDDSENVVFDDKDVKVVLSSDFGEIAISLSLNKDGWDQYVAIYEGYSSKEAVKAIKKAIHTGLCVHRGNQEVVSKAYESLRKGE